MMPDIERGALRVARALRAAYSGRKPVKLVAMSAFPTLVGRSEELNALQRDERRWFWFIPKGTKVGDGTMAQDPFELSLLLAFRHRESDEFGLALLDEVAKHGFTKTMGREIFCAPASVAVLSKAVDAATDPTVSTVLIRGPSGAGKETLCALIHRARHASNAARPFVMFNCKTPDSLVVSELFGHRRGSFSGAIDTSDGYLKRAGNGTLYLAELGKMPRNGQEALLQALSARTFRQIGGSTDVALEASLIIGALTDQDQLIDELRWRFDVALELPGLDERPEDIVPAARLMLENRHIALADDVAAYLASGKLSLPGNYRDLSRLLHKASMGFKRTIEIGDIIAAGEWLTAPQPAATSEAPPAKTWRVPETEEEAKAMVEAFPVVMNWQDFGRKLGLKGDSVNDAFKRNGWTGPALTNQRERRKKTRS
jgi:DNA-binding NtrC family response regulator